MTDNELDAIVLTDDENALIEDFERLTYAEKVAVIRQVYAENGGLN